MANKMWDRQRELKSQSRMVYKIHESLIAIGFLHDENGEIRINEFGEKMMEYQSVTYERDFTKLSQVYKPELLHNNSKRRRIAKLKAKEELDRKIIENFSTKEVD